MLLLEDENIKYGIKHEDATVEFYGEELNRVDHCEPPNLDKRVRKIPNMVNIVD